MPFKLLKKSRQQYNVMSKDLYVISVVCLGEEVGEIFEIPDSPVIHQHHQRIVAERMLEVYCDQSAAKSKKATKKDFKFMSCFTSHAIIGDLHCV